MKVKMLIFAGAVMLFASFARECQAQSNLCGAASFTFYGNFQNQQVRLYFIGVDGSLYNTLANNLAGNYADPQAAYLYDAIMNSNNPIASVVAQIVVNSNGVAQDGPNTFVAPNSPQLQSMLQEALVWSYMHYWYSNLNQQSEMNLEQTDFQQVYQSEWQQQAGITAASWVNSATVIGQLAEYLPSLMGDADAATQVGDFVSLFQDASEDYSGLQSAFAGNATNILNVLTNYGVVTDQNFTSAQLVVGMANLDPSRLPQFETDLYAAAYPSVTLKPNAQPVITTFLENAGAGAEKLGISASASGAYAFYQAYGVYELTASTSAKIALSQAGTYFTSGLTALAAAQLITSSYTTPQSDILQDMVYCQNILTTNLFPELNTMSSQMMSNNGFPNFDNGVGFAADIEAISSFEALWCNLGAQEETNQFVQTQLQQYITLGPAFGGRAASMYGTLVSANTMAQNLANQSAAISAPAVNGLGETHGVLGDEFTISGANLCNAVAVYFSNSPAWFQVNSSTSITTVAPAGTNTVDIRVVGPGGVSQINANDKFTYGTSSTTTNVLSVTSSNPGSGVSITVSPNDTGGNGNGSTPFARNYTNNTQVTLTAPSTAGGNNFQKWQQNGADYSTSHSATVTMNANYTMTAVYTSPPSATYTLTVASSNPNSGVSISASPNDNGGLAGGSTSFALTYNSNTVVYLTAPATAGGNNFQTWQLDGVTYNNARSAGLTMNGNHTMTAVYGGIGIIGLSGNLSFGTVQAGASAVRTFTIQSQGGYQPLHVSGITYPPGFSGAWSGTIPIGGSTNVVVTFAPTTNGFYSGLVTVNSDATLGSNSISASGTGVVAPPPPPVTPFPTGPFTVIYSFPYQSSLSGPFAFGANPGAGLVQGTDGDFYGTTVYGGGYGEGVIFRMNAAGSNQLLYLFPAKTSQPGAQLTFGNDGNLYGTMRWGGVHGLGSVFRLSNGVFSTIYSFAESSSDQSGEPISPLIQGTDGYFYGTTRWGWNGGGSVFKVTSTGAFTLLNSLDDSQPGVGFELIAPLVQGMDGNLYGTTFGGGTNGPGTVFKLTLSGALTPLYSFTGGLDGGHPQAGLVQDKSGYLYGTTSGGGTFGDGTVFKMATNGSLIWAVSFNGTNGSNAGYGIPAFLEAPLIQASDGNLYGVTPSGGGFGDGTVFQISTNGLLAILHSFQGSDGANPFGLMQGRDGNLYGTTWEGGTDGGGTVFRLVIPLGTPSVTTTGGVLNINWNAVPGQIYQVQYSTDLRQTNWMVLISAVTPTNATATATDAVGPDSQRFYRIVEFPEAW
jgi:uncharacterized repeat protein (TIGR03803 family)